MKQISSSSFTVTRSLSSVASVKWTMSRENVTVLLPLINTWQ